MKKEKVFIILSFVFMVLTFIGATCVVFKQINAGYAEIPGLFSIIFFQLVVYEKSKKNKEELEEIELLEK